MLSFFYYIVIGLIVGALAKWIMPGRDPGGFIVTIIIGIVGGMIGGYLGQIFGGVGTIVNFILSLVGALILLGGYRLLKKGT